MSDCLTQPTGNKLPPVPPCTVLCCSDGDDVEKIGEQVAALSLGAAERLTQYLRQKGIVCPGSAKE